MMDFMPLLAIGTIVKKFKPNYIFNKMIMVS